MRVETWPRGVWTRRPSARQAATFVISARLDAVTSHSTLRWFDGDEFVALSGGGTRLKVWFAPRSRRRRAHKRGAGATSVGGLKGLARRSRRRRRRWRVFIFGRNAKRDANHRRRKCLFARISAAYLRLESRRGTDRQTGGQTDGQAGEQTNKQTDRQTDRQTDGRTDKQAARTISAACESTQAARR